MSCCPNAVSIVPKPCIAEKPNEAEKGIGGSFAQNANNASEIAKGICRGQATHLLGLSHCEYLMAIEIRCIRVGEVRICDMCRASQGGEFA